MNIKTTDELLWYTKEAPDFNSALPVGNGRMGAMIFGGASKDTIKLNEDSVYSGGKRNRINPRAFEGMQEIRQLLEKEEIEEAEKIAFQKMQGITPNARHYMPLGTLTMYHGFTGKAREYQRSLDLQEAVARVKFHDDSGVNYLREAFVSYPAQLLVISVKADIAGTIDFSALLDGRDDYYDDNRPVEENVILYTGGTGSRNGIFFASGMMILTKNGSVETIGNALQVHNADEALLLLSMETSFYQGDNYIQKALERLHKVSDKAKDISVLAEQLKAEHIEDYQKLYQRVKFRLEDNSEGASQLPTDQRIARLKGNADDDKECHKLIHDNQLGALYFNYGRYLMISASRPGSQPMNLQGIWNEDMWPAWGCRFT
ncbi:MAG: glycoside hydrolase family 95 protein, partial [Ruminococcus sp.]|nr:glycoside hydrolase family 95 protein [Ruminococcus sp.]